MPPPRPSHPRTLRRRASSTRPSSGSPRSARATGRARCARSSGPSTTPQRLLLGETINPPGNWSSYPPHRHDRHNPPDEVDLEEVYLFRVNPAGGFGIQIRYELDGDRAEESFLVRDDDVAVIRSGFHPVAAASGYELYYLWVMAGEGRVMMPHLDPAHAWVQNGG